MAVQNTEACQPQQSLQTSKCIHEAWTETRDRVLKRSAGEESLPAIKYTATPETHVSRILQGLQVTAMQAR